MNLMESLLNEIERNAKVAERYRAIGPEGTFGATMIRIDIEKAKAAIVSGDVAAMIRAHEALKNTKE